MSGLSWDFPSSPTNPSEEDDAAQGNGGRPDGDHDVNGNGEAALAELLEREQLEQLERKQLEELARLQSAQFEAPADLEDSPERGVEDFPEETDDLVPMEASERGDELERQQAAQIEELDRQQAAQIEEFEREERSEREELERMEREQLEQLAQLEGNPDLADALRQLQPPRPEPQPAPDRTRARPFAASGSPDTGRPRALPFAGAAAAQGPAPGERARAVESFLAEAQQWQPDEAPQGARPVAGPADWGRDEPARAAQAIVEHRHQNLVEANQLLTDARRILAPIAYRGLSDRIYRRRKVIFAIGEAISLAVAFSAAFDVAPLEALLLSGAIALAFVVAGDLGGILRISAERSRLTAAMEDDVVHLDPRYVHILYQARQPWLTTVGCAAAGLFGLSAVSVGVLRAASRDSWGLAAGLGLLTVTLAMAAGLSSWQHTSIGSEIIDHLQREEEAAARRLRRAAAARVLRRRGIRTTGLGFGDRSTVWEVPTSDVRWEPPDTAPWEAPDLAAAVAAPKRSKRAKRGKSQQPREGPGRVGMAAAKGAVLLASLPGRLRRAEKSERRESSSSSGDEEQGPGPGAGGESAGAISDVHFTPPIRVQKPF